MQATVFELSFTTSQTLSALMPVKLLIPWLHSRY